MTPARPIRRFGTPEPTLCGACRRRAGSWGYCRDNPPILWLCADPACLGAGKKVYTMSAQQMDAFEEKAVDAASEAAGGLLDGLGLAETPLASLTPEQWRAMIVTAVETFQTRLRTMLENGEAPF